jgi:outer membrane protein assembly factor BamB
MASSPALIDETLVVQVEDENDSFATGLDIHTGQSRWRIDRPKRMNWTSSALALDGQGRKIAIFQAADGLTAIEPQTGTVLWNYKAADSTIPSPVVVDKTVYAPSNGLMALDLASQGNPPALLWHENKLASATASPLVFEGRVFTLNNGGVLNCGDAKTGNVAWRLRLKGPFSGTPVAAAGHIYIFSEKGTGQVIKPSADKGEVVDTAELGESIMSTPAIAGEAVYVRSDQHLWKFGK